MNLTDTAKYNRLLANIMDMVQENQLKLGYIKEIQRLYYPLDTINHLLDTVCTAGQMLDMLFADPALSDAGISVSRVSGNRFCFELPARMAEDIHEHYPPSLFLKELIRTVEKHHTTLADVTAVFHRYSARVHEETASGGDFDLLVYFEDGVPDAYRYCLTQEMGHVTYHRFIREDYESLC